MASGFKSLATKNSPPNSVIRKVCCRCGHLIDYLAVPHDGSEESIINAAQRVTQMMWEIYDNVSNINSPMIATGADGKPQWSISQNFRILTQI